VALIVSFEDATLSAFAPPIKSAKNIERMTNPYSSAYFINITTSSSINVRYTEKDLGQNAKFELFSYHKDLKALR
jgi:hypothetical protein